MYFRSRSPFSTFFVCQQLLLGGEEEQESRGKQTKSLQLLCCEQTKTNTETLVLSMNFSGINQKNPPNWQDIHTAYIPACRPCLRLEGKKTIPVPVGFSANSAGRWKFVTPKLGGSPIAEVMISWESKGLLTLIFIDPLIKLRYLYRDHHGNLRVHVHPPKLPKTPRNVRPTSRRTRSGLSCDA